MAFNREMTEVGRRALSGELAAHGMTLEVTPGDRAPLHIVDDRSGKRIPAKLYTNADVRFSLHRNLDDVSGLVIAVIWNATHKPRYFFMSFNEAFGILGVKAASTTSWLKDGYYSFKSPGDERLRRIARLENRWNWLSERLAA